MAKSRMVKLIWQDRLFNGLNLTLMTLILLVIAYPLYFVVIASFTKPEVVQNGPVKFFL